MGGGGGVPQAPRGPGTRKAGARWFLRRPRQERRCAAAGPEPTRLLAPSPGGPPSARGVILLRGPAASHLPGGRSAAPPPPSRSPDPSFARRPGGCRAGASWPSLPPPRIPGAAASRGAVALSRRRRGRRPLRWTLGLCAPPAPAPWPPRWPLGAPGPAAPAAATSVPRAARSQERRFAAREVGAP